MTSDSENYIDIRAFFTEEYHSLKSYARSKIYDAADRDAEDIIQEVTLKIFSRSRTASPITNIAGFVYSAAKNKIVDPMRTKKEMTNIEHEMETGIPRRTLMSSRHRALANLFKQLESKK